MHEFEPLPVREGVQPLAGGRGGGRGLQSLEPGQSEDGVVKVGLPRPIQAGAARVEAPQEEVPDQLRRVLQDVARHPRDLPHLQLEAHERVKAKGRTGTFRG